MDVTATVGLSVNTRHAMSAISGAEAAGHWVASMELHREKTCQFDSIIGCLSSPRSPCIFSVRRVAASV